MSEPVMQEGEHIVPAAEVALLGVELGGVAEISEEFGVPRSTISMWNTRRVAGFPEPLVHLKSGPIYSMPEVREWWNKRSAS